MYLCTVITSVLNSQIMILESTVPPSFLLWRIRALIKQSYEKSFNYPRTSAGRQSDYIIFFPNYFVVDYLPNTLSASKHEVYKFQREASPKWYNNIENSIIEVQQFLFSCIRTVNEFS